MSFINLSALWKIVVFGLLAGAGLPALFAAGMLSLSRGPKTRTAGADSEAVVGGSLAGTIIAGPAFLQAGQHCRPIVYIEAWQESVRPPSRTVIIPAGSGGAIADARDAGRT